MASQTKRPGGSTQCWLGRCLVSLVLRLMDEYSPNDPLRCGLNSCPSNTSALRNLPQFANSRLGSAPCCLVSALFGRLHTFYRGLSVPPPLLWPWRHGWVGLGCQIFFRCFFAVAVTRCLRLMLHLGRVPQATAGSVLLHGVQAFPGHRIFS